MTVGETTRRAALLAAAACLAPVTAAVAQPAMAQSVTSQTVVVTGYRAQNQQAAAAKRDEDRIAEFITSDDIGQQPDYNISDSFRRVAGVQTIFDEDEGRYVSIRGLNPNFTVGSLDGSTIATAERFNRQLNLESVPTTAVRRLEVFKSRTPDAEGNAIGGTINLVTRSAFDRSGMFWVANGFIGASDSTKVPGEGFGRDSDDGPNFRFDGTFSTTFGANDQFGVLITGAFSRKRRDQERLLPGAYTVFNNVPVTTQHLWSSYPNSVDRYGGTVKLEWRPTRNLETALSVTHYVQVDNELRHSHQLTRGTIVSATGDTARVSTAGGFVRFNDFPIEKPLTSVQLTADWEPSERQTLKARAAYSEATFLEPSNQLQFNLPTSAANAYTYANIDRAPTFVFDNPATFNNPAAYAFGGYTPYQDDSDDYVSEAGLDYGFNTDRGDEGWGFGAGLKWRENTRDFDTRQATWGLAPGQTLTLADVLQPTNYTPPYSSVPQLFIDFRRFQAIFAGSPTRFVLNTAATNLAAVSRDYVVTETVGAAYGLARHAGERHTVVFGARFEDTQTDVNGFRVTGSVVRPLVRSGGYDHLLPSVTGTFDLGPDLKLRGGYYKAIGRPNPSDLGNNESVNQTALTVSRGNPDLQPREADNFDLSLDYYMPDDGGVISIAAFHKDISNDIFNAAAGTTVIDGSTLQVTQPRNLSGSTMTGLELSVVRNRLTGLPGFLENLGVSANITLLDGSATLPNGIKVNRLLSQADLLANIAVFYEQGPIQARITYAHVGSYLSTFDSTNPLNNRFDEAYNQVDLQGRYGLGAFEFIGEVRNATGQRRANYDVFGARDLNYFGRQFWLGVAWKP